MKKRKWRKVLGFIIVLALSMCGCQQRQNGNDEQMAATENAADVWKEQWIAVLDSGEKMPIEMRCTIDTEELLNSIVDASILEIDSKNKEEIAKWVFGDEVYLFDAQNMCKEDLKKRLVKEEALLEKGYRWLEYLEGMHRPNAVRDFRKKTIPEFKSRVKQVKKLLKTAKEERVPAQDGAYDSDSYMGYLDGIAYQLEFIPHTQGDKAFKVSDTTWWRYYTDDIPYNIELLPVDWKDFAPEEIRDAYQVSSNVFSGDDDSVLNACSLTVEEAGEKAAAILQKLGFMNMVQISADALVWQGTDANGVEGKKVVDGYNFGFQTGIEGHALNMMQDISDDYTDYFDREEVVVQVNDKGVVKVLADHTLQVESITPDIKLLEIEDVKDMLRAQLSTYIQEYKERYEMWWEGEASAGDSRWWDGEVSSDNFRGTSSQMVYCRMRDPENPQHFTYVPAWELTGYFERVNIIKFYINAIDGSYIAFDTRL